jgi:probable F420-dependent oxidoreductase
MGNFDVDVMVAGFKVGQVGELAAATKSAGLSGVAFTEGGRTAYLGATAAALAADGLDVATAVAVAFPRSPMVTASIAWELAELTRGRFLLGLGTQVKAHVERRYSAEFDPPGPRLREYVLALRAIFAGFQGTAPLNFEGDYYHFSLLPPTWSPGPIDYPDVPIYIAAVNEWMVRMAGEVCDGIQVHPFHSPTYLRDTLKPAVAEGAKKAGRDPGDVKLAVPLMTIVGDTEEERAVLRERARTQIAFYGSTKNYGFLFDQLGFEGTSARLNTALKAGDMAGMSAIITDEMLPHYAVEASWDDLADVLRDRYDGLADRLVLYFASEMWRRDQRALDRFGEVAKALRAG